MAVSLSFLILLGITIIGLVFVFYQTATNEYVPENRNSIFHDGKDLQVIVTIENNTQVPLANFFNHKLTQVNVEVYYKVTPLFLKGIKLSSNGSSILTVKDADFHVANRASKQNVTTVNSLAAVYNVSMQLGHPLDVRTYDDQYNINLFYRKLSDNGSLLVEKVPFIWSIHTLDWSKVNYFWLIFAGVFLSRIFTIRPGNKTKFKSLELVWIPFSAIITLLVFASFKDQVNLTGDILTNLSLAFGFGFAFDKVLEVWQKSPELDREPEKTNTQ
jgi:hypothetical protein